MGARPPARRFGPALAAQGAAWVDRLVLRYWPDQGGWWEARVGGWSAPRAKHKLIYDASTDNVRAPLAGVQGSFLLSCKEIVFSPNP